MVNCAAIGIADLISTEDARNKKVQGTFMCFVYPVLFLRPSYDGQAMPVAQSIHIYTGDLIIKLNPSPSNL